MPRAHLRTNRIRGPAGAALIGACLLSVAACRREPLATVVDPASRATLHRQMTAGEVHTYRLVLAAGQYLQLSVDQHRADLVVTLLDRDRRPLLVVDNPSGSDGSRGKEPIAWVAETGGDHTLKVEVRNGWTLPGCYRLAVEKLGLPSDEDRHRAAAESAITAGDALYGRGDQDSRQQAVEQYLEARAAFEGLQDHSRSADALYRIARVRRALGERQQAIELFDQSAKAYQDVGNHRQAAVSLFQLCKLRREDLELEKALAACREALPLWESVEDPSGWAKTLNELGFVHRLLGDGRLAIANYDQALGLWRRIGDEGEQARVLHNRGRIYDFRGKKAQAVDDLSAALEIQSRLHEPSALATTLSTLGQVHDRYGETAEARRYFEQALEIADVDSRRQAITRTGLAWVRLDLGETRQALELFRQALETFRSRDSLTWEAAALQGIGAARAALGDLPQGLDSLRQALVLCRRIRDRSGEAEALLAMAGIERRRGDLEVARTEIEEALVIVDDLRTRISALSPARAYYQAVRQDYFDFHVDLLMDLHQRDPGAGHDSEALTAFERARARSLLELLSQSGTDLERGVDEAWFERRRQLKQQIQLGELRLVRWAERPQATPAGAVAQIEREQSGRLREYEKLEEQIRAGNPRFAAATRPRTLTAEEIRRQIVDVDTVLLAYKLGEARSYVWAVTPEGVVSHVLPARSEIEPRAVQAYDLLAGNQTRSRRRLHDDLLPRLSDLLLGRVTESMRGRRRLLVVAEGALQLLPFAVLPAADGYEVVHLPSASALAVLRERARERVPAPKWLAMVADPVYGADDDRLGDVEGLPLDAPYPRLRFAGEEAEGILSLVPVADRLAAVGFEADLDKLAGGFLGEARLVHFATHGELDMEHPELSRLVLSLVDERGLPRDGLLHAYQIYDFELAADLVTLSACQTALGTQLRGEGLLGLPQAFLHAGAERVLVSLWQVHDRSTAELMKSFYRGLLVDGLSPPAALLAAQDTIRRQEHWREPYYWAGFVLQGEWRDLRRQVETGLTRSIHQPGSEARTALNSTVAKST